MHQKPKPIDITVLKEQNQLESHSWSAYPMSKHKSHTK